MIVSGVTLLRTTFVDAAILAGILAAEGSLLLKIFSEMQSTNTNLPWDASHEFQMDFKYYEIQIFTGIQ
jgi:hypothetical protein